MSGGERSRLCILQMILSGANLLLIDEPTNHLDIESCEAVEQMLSSYDGAMLLVSHDRFFIDQVADAIVALEERHLNYYCGNYSYYQQKRQEQQKRRIARTTKRFQSALKPKNVSARRECSEPGAL